MGRAGRHAVCGGDLIAFAAARQTRASADAAAQLRQSRNRRPSAAATRQQSATPTAPANGSRAGAAKPKDDIIWQIGQDRQSFFPAPRRRRSLSGNGYMTVVPMVFGSAMCMILFSLLTPPAEPGDDRQIFSD